MGKHEAPRSGLPVALVAALLAVVLVAIGGVVAYRARTTSAPAASGAPSTPAGCPTVAQATTVAVTSSMADLVKAAAARVSAGNPCTTYAISSADSAATAAQLAGAGRGPDTWVTDSSAWVDVVRAARPGRLATGAQPIAVSPLALAVPASRPAAKKPVGPPATWKAVLAGHSGLTVALPDPERSTAGRLLLLQAPGAVGTAGPAARVELGKILLGWSHAPAVTESALFAALTSRRPSAFPASEQAVTAYSVEHPGVVSAVVPSGGTPAYDYTLVSSADLPATASVGVAALRKELGSPTTRTALRAAGFRADESADGTGVAGAKTGQVAYSPVVAQTTQTSLLKTWRAVKTDARMLALIDTSGSMSEKTGGTTRMALATGAAATAVSILPAATEIGTWTFGIDKGGPGQDWDEVAPIRRLDQVTAGVSQRQALARDLPGIADQVGGGTGLYATVLAAYQKMVKEYQVGRSNSVILLTDGRNEDPGGPTLAQVLSAINAEKDPTRPVIIVTIGMGTDVDTAALDAISSATGGSSYIATNPADITGVFIDAILLRRCTAINCVAE